MASETTGAPCCPGGTIWKGILAANLATYAVLAPLHYRATRPMHQVREFTPNTAWAQQPSATVLFTDHNGHLNAIRTDGRRHEPSCLRWFAITWFPPISICSCSGAGMATCTFIGEMRPKAIWSCVDARTLPNGAGCL